MTADEASAQVHAAIGSVLDDGEFAMAWCLTIDVAGADGRRYLAHRAGGGMDGTERPMAWTALGMLTASADRARVLLHEWTVDEPGRDDEPGE